MFSNLYQKDSADSVQLVEIPIDEIIANAQVNPRLSINESYDEIRNSLYSTQGRYLVLEVSKRPDDSPYYELRRGGNTRLLIAKELRDSWDLSDDNPFHKIRCIVFPWVDESENAIMNVTENIARGTLSYCEMARAVCLLQTVYRDTPGVDTDSAKAFIAWAKNLGLSVSISNAEVTRYRFTNDVLAVNMPQLIVNARANREAVKWLMMIRKQISDVFKDHYEDTTLEDNVSSSNVKARADALFTQVCRAMDGAVLERKTFQHAVVEALSDALSLTAKDKAVFGQRPLCSARSRLSQHYKLSENNAFTDDPGVNSALILDELLRQGEFSSPRKISRRLNLMGVGNDLGGFVQLVRTLDKKGRKLVAQALLEV